MFRFIAVAWNTSSTEASTASTRLLQRVTGSRHSWVEALARPGLKVFYAGARGSASDIYPLSDSAGVVLGTVFERLDQQAYRNDALAFSPPKRAVFGESDTKRAVQSGGKTLISSFWGRYVAFIVNAAGDRTWILRDPTGELPCYFARYCGVTIAFSYLPDLLDVGLVHCTINWKYVGTYVSGGQEHTEQTALNEISRLRGGECIEITRSGNSREFYWNPEELINREPIEDCAVASRMLRHVVGCCTSAWASCYPRLVHQTSGGLDSSIVLQCLARSLPRPDVTCLTYYVPGGNSDERPLARLAAESAEARQIEHGRDPRFDLRDLFQYSPSVVPEADFAAIETGRSDRRYALTHGASVVFDGTGGDYLFYRGSHEYAAGDFLWRHGAKPRLLSIATDVALLTDRTLWQVLIDACRDRFQLREWELARGVLGHRKLISRDLLAQASRIDPVQHPWLRDPGKLPPGALLPVLCLTLPPHFYDPLWRPGSESIERVSPLLSQPVAELCLSIPSYTHIADGRDRGIARRAFSGLVPEPILNRQWKDRAAGFINTTLALNLPFIREVLSDGILVKEQLLDRDRLSKTLSGALDHNVPYPLELLDHLATEIWLQQRIDRAERAAA